jgi:hypothetical protein
MPEGEEISLRRGRIQQGHTGCAPNDEPCARFASSISDVAKAFAVTSPLSPEGAVNEGEQPVGDLESNVTRIDLRRPAEDLCWNSLHGIIRS